MGEAFITRRGGVSTDIIFHKLPVLDENYPADISAILNRGESISKTFTVSIAEAGIPATVTYQWYVNGVLQEGATDPGFTFENITSGGTYEVYCIVSNAVGPVISRTATLTVVEQYTPVLNASYPADVTQFQYAGSATFQVAVSEDGKPAEYTYQWYQDGVAISGATGTSVTLANMNTVGAYKIFCRVTNAAGHVDSRTVTLTIKKAIPTYSYSGTSQFIDDGSGNWRIKFKTTGTLTFTDLGNAANGIQVFCVGGGGGGGGGCTNETVEWGLSGEGAGGGGAGGYTKTSVGTTPAVNTGYTITIGAGGSKGKLRSGTLNTTNAGTGGTSSAFGVSASGGSGGHNGSNPSNTYGGNGGSGGGKGCQEAHDVCWGGSNGGNGYGAGSSRGYGQGSTTREFGESTGQLYAGGGGGGCRNWGGNHYRGGDGGAGGGGNGGSVSHGQSAGTANTGGGGGGGAEYSSYDGSDGGSGIVVIRNKR